MLASHLAAWLCLATTAGAVSNPDPAGSLARFEFVETHMGCSFKLVLYSTGEAEARSASRAAFDRIATLDACLSDYQADSELSRLGLLSGGPPVPVSADLFDVLRLSKDFHARTGGVLDVTIAPVGRLWRRARRDRKLPDPDLIAKARELVGADMMTLDPAKRTVRLAKAGMRLDVGGIAKGYASQAAIDVLRSHGVPRALVGGAGDIVLGDPPPDAEGWTIAVSGLDPKAEPLTYLSLRDCAVSTSGDAERFVVIDGKRYSHIINPVTGMGVVERASVTVVAPDGGTADSLETSVYMMGPERGLALIESMPGVAAVYVRETPEGPRVQESSRFKELPRTTAKPATAAPGPLPRPLPLPSRAPETLGFDAERLARIDAAIDRSIAAGEVPGAVVLVGRRGAVAHAYAAGKRAVEPSPDPMTRDALFDMASITKPVATATSVMILLEEGKLRLSDRIVRYLPELDNHGKARITIEHLLRHRAGLIADNPIGDFANGPEEAWKRIAALELEYEPGEKLVYSDVGYMILGRLVERISGQSLDRFAAERIFGPAGMADAHFRPIGSAGPMAPADRCVPTERDRPGGEMLRGKVHDPRSRALGGVAGHAGLFATADDLAAFARMMLAGGVAANGRRVLAPLTVRTMIDPGSTPPGQRRGLGWDVATGQSGPRGALFGPSSYGHTGFTGTSIWIDPETDAFVILLTSRLHPDGKGASPADLRARVATLTAAAIVDAPATRPASAGAESPSPAPPAAASALRPDRPADVLCGIDVLAADGFKPLQGRRVGLVTNHTGRSRDGRSTIDVLFRAPGVTLVRLFSPEHGIRGEVDAAVADGKDAATGLPVISLYGSRRKPTAADLEGIDDLVYDIQDIGVRYYTYSTTLGLVLEAAKESSKRLVVLDRPNPIGGLAVGGPVLDAGLESFIAYHALPVRHGMTLGELARLYNAERKIGASLEVIPCKGWTRERTYDRTGLLWVNPSPNMRSPTEALLYPGVGWLEATNLATGRGTDTPFERVGAPWIEPVAFAAALNASGVPGARFVPLTFAPAERQFKGEKCGGVLIEITDRSAFDPLRLGLSLALTLRKLHPNDWKPEKVLGMLGDRASQDAILKGKDAAEIMASWGPELEEFRKVRARYLLYDRSAD
ncbi:exo-beta-N-acetylmuramidase NamZ domain-containing protein [Aquisphaera insulae]|uniref:exo-beta-N-acetylmuramidase NamZ domain-containing protein n=1 Tax=Aquisphaera insulae TaxID=2712864 RepID=UPI00202DCE3D|nr:exo-beta-N-acetylmuramidase NamZ domain-containing protein [Aquisphaera insulae]